MLVFPALHLFIQNSGLFDSAVRLIMPYVLWIAVSMLAGWRSIACARRVENRSVYIAWLWFGAGAITWSAGILLELVSLRWVDSFEIIIGARRLFYLAYPVMLVAGMFALLSFRTRTLGLFNLANIGVIGSAMVVCAMFVLLQPVIQSEESTAYILFSIADLTMLFTTAIVALHLLWAQGPPTSRSVIVLLTLSASLHAAANIGYYLDEFRLGAYDSDLDIFWLVALMLHYWAAHEQAHLTELDPGEAPETRWIGRISDSARVFFPSALIIGNIAVAFFFAENLTKNVIEMALLHILAFAIFLGLREWALDRHRKGLVNELSALNSLNSHVLRASPGVVVIFEVRNGYRVTYVSENGRLLFGIDSTNFDFETHVHRQDQKLTRECLRKALQVGDASCEFRLLGKEGEWHWIDQRVVLRRNANDDPAELIGTMLDITERKSLQLSVEQTQRIESLGRLSGSIAHDFNNLLTVIIGFSDLLLSDPTLNDANREKIAEINAAAERGAALTLQLLTFSRRHAVSIEVIDINEVVTNMGEMLERLLADDASLDLRICKSPVRIEGNRNQIEQVVLNLVINASEAMPNGGRIRLTTGEVNLEKTAGVDEEAGGNFALISISDEGPGIDDSIRKQIFEPFFTTKTEGTGLGLATVHGVVRQHGGRIKVGEGAEGGARFDVLLPTTRRPQSPDTSVPAPLVKSGKERIIVVDDEMAITRVIASALRPMGYTVLTANSADEAVAIAKDQSFHLILSDVIMPVSNGFELVDRLRKVQPDFRVIFMSGYTDDVIARQLLRDNKTPLLQKPINLGQLAIEIRRQLDAAATAQSADSN